MKESALVRRILRQLNAVDGCKAIKLHGGPYSEAGTPDVIGVYRGTPFLIECKVGRNGLTRIQMLRIAEWLAAKAVVQVATEDFDVEDFLGKIRFSA